MYINSPKARQAMAITGQTQGWGLGEFRGSFLEMAFVLNAEGWRISLFASYYHNGMPEMIKFIKTNSLFSS